MTFSWLLSSSSRASAVDGSWVCPLSVGTLAVEKEGEKEEEEGEEAVTRGAPAAAAAASVTVGVRSRRGASLVFGSCWASVPYNVQQRSNNSDGPHHISTPAPLTTPLSNNSVQRNEKSDPCTRVVPVTQCAITKLANSFCKKKLLWERASALKLVTTLG